MKTKIFTLAILSILSMVILLSGVSATVFAQWPLTSDGSATSVNADVTAGSFTAGSGLQGSIVYGSDGAYDSGWGSATSINESDYYQVTIAPKSDYNLSLSDIDFAVQSTSTGPMNFQLKWSKSSAFTSSTVIETYALATNDTEYVRNLSISISVAEGETLYLRWYAYNASGATGNFYLKSINTEGTISEDLSGLPSEIQSCTTTGNSLGNLEINKIKFSNEGISGTNFGDDEEWYSLSDVDVTVEIKNRGEEKIEDVEVSWGLWDASANQWTIEPIDEDKFDIKSGKDETITFRVNLENDLDIDIDELDDGDYEFYVFAYGYDNENESDICTSDYKDISVVVESDFVVLDNINVQDLIECGSDVQITADVWNIGDRDQDDAYVKIFNSELGINKRVDFSTIDMFDKEPLDVMISIPDSAVEKTYYLRFDVYDDNEDIFESNSDDSSFLVPVLVQGNCASSIGSATVSASLDSEAKAGQPLTVRTTISNSGTASATYTINSAGYASWANSATVDISTFTIGAGESKQVTITLGVKDDASGEQTFNIEVLSGGQLIKTQPVAVTIAGKSAFSSITGGAIGGNGLIWGIGIINVILIIVIIIVAIKVARK